jgi:VWFA-related protein
MNRRFRSFLLIVTSASLAAQSSTDPVFRATTKLIQVSVIAQDQDGKPVADLKREDFQLFDHGKPQPIQLFIAEKPAPPEPLAPHTFTNKLARSTGYSVLLLDANSTIFQDAARMRLAALKALQEIPPDDKIAIYSLWCQFRVAREFTSDRGSLVQYLTAFSPAAGGCASGSIGDGTEGTMLAGHAEAVSQASQKTEQQKEFARQAAVSTARTAAEASRIASLENGSASDQEIQHMADHLAGIPGRKNLIWLADGFPLSPSGLRKLLDAGVAVYPGSALGSTIALASEKKDAAIPLLALAAMTGGVANVDNDDLDIFIRKALDDGRISYTLGFYQSNQNQSKDDTVPGHVKPDQPDVHQIGVRVSRPGITLRYRTSYSVQPPPPASASPVADLVQAMNHPADETAIGITVTALRYGDATRTQDRLDLKATVDLANLDLELSDGLWKGSVEIVARFMTAQAVQAGDVVSETAAIKLSETPYQAMLKSGFAYHKELMVPPKAVELKLLVGNLASGKIGTVTIPLSEVKEK